MRESILHYIWKYQKFDHQDLLTTRGQSVRILTNGYHNNDSGPDFSEAKIMVDGLLWVGQVEIHVKSSDWKHHGHNGDPAYQNVILHVVWEDDQEVILDDGTTIPTLSLKDRVDQNFVKKSIELLNSPEEVPCANQISSVKSIQISAMLSQTIVHRLEQKSVLILKSLGQNRGSWEETAFQLLARNFGFKVNAEVFEKLARSVTYKICLKHKTNLKQLEALLFGMAGFLPGESIDDYTALLLGEYKFLAKKYHLADLEMLKVEWKFLRMRPGNFPTIRISQLAAFLGHNEKFFNQFIHFSDLRELKAMFAFEPSNYWSTHYDFGKMSKRAHHGIGASSVEVLVINTVAPLLAAYSQKSNNPLFMEKAIDLLESLKPEKNNIVNAWLDSGVAAKTAMQSQALIALYNDFCLKRKCLACKIGGTLISQ